MHPSMPRSSPPIDRNGLTLARSFRSTPSRDRSNGASDMATPLPHRMMHLCLAGYPGLGLVATRYALAIRHSPSTAGPEGGGARQGALARPRSASGPSPRRAWECSGCRSYRGSRPARVEASARSTRPRRRCELVECRLASYVKSGPTESRLRRPSLRRWHAAGSSRPRRSAGRSTSGLMLPMTVAATAPVSVLREPRTRRRRAAAFGVSTTWRS